MPRKTKLKQIEDYPAQRAFILAFRATMSVKAAAAAAKIEPFRHFGWMRGTDPPSRNYQADFLHAQEMCAQALEDEAIRRAYEGVKKQLYYRGRPMKTGRGRNARYAVETNYSDQLLIRLLERFKPDAYRQRTETQVTGAVEIVDRMQAARARLIEMQKNEQPSTGT